MRRDPNLWIYIVKIDLTDPRVSVHVSRAGADPDGSGPWLTTLLPTSEVAKREGYDIAVNGDFFEAKATTDIEGKQTGYVTGKFARPMGLAMTDGQLWSDPTNISPFLEMTSKNLPKLMSGQPDSEAREIISGNPIIVSNKKPVVHTNQFALARHPRTAVGFGRNGTMLILLVVDGRQPALSIGMTLSELSDEMIRAGCDEAINLDGGGSTTLVDRDPATKKLKVVNSPSDGRERSVADVLGVKVDAPLPPFD